MLIANPIYDTVFKFLLEDTAVAKQLISAIIGEEIVELEAKPQEQTTVSNKFLLTVFRVDFKAVVKTANGDLKKILIELQKSNHAFDILRFRHYLGTNYSQTDEVNGMKMNLPLLPIYFLGFNLSVKRPVLKIGRSYQDVATGEILKEKDDFIENLSHDCYVVQIRNLPPQMRSKLEKLLSVFDQKWVFDQDQKWLLKYPSDGDDADMRLILKRLSLAAESPVMKEQIRVEEEFDTSMENVLRANEIIIAQNEIIIEQKKAVIEQKEAVIEQKEAVIEQKEAVIEQKEAVIEQKEAVIEQKEKENQGLLQRIAELEQKLKQ
ncbi:MAG: hypothetical protein ACKVUS_20905 [Saprospiraceae bacterium]